MYEAMMKKVIQANKLRVREGEWVEDTEGMWRMGEEYLVEGEDAGSVYQLISTHSEGNIKEKATRARKELKKLHQKGKKQNILNILQLPIDAAELVSSLSAGQQLQAINWLSADVNRAR